MTAPPSLRIYLREIGEYELLTADDEVALAQRIEAGCSEARALLINHNLRLVVRIAQDYQIPTMPLPDLINEGNIGLMKAVERFDWRRGQRFAGCASTWINSHIRRAISNKSRLVRVPEHAIRLHRADPENTQSTELLHNSLDEDIYAGGLHKDNSSSGARARRESQLEELVSPEIESSPSPALLRMALSRAMNVLTAREREVIHGRFATKGGPVESLRDTGKRLGLSYERIRQIQDEAMEKLRTVAEGLGLREYL